MITQTSSRLANLEPSIKGQGNKISDNLVIRNRAVWQAILNVTIGDLVSFPDYVFRTGREIS